MLVGFQPITINFLDYVYTMVFDLGDYTLILPQIYILKFHTHSP